MGLMDILKSAFGLSESEPPFFSGLTATGRTDAVCPNCRHTLKKKPRRKSPCPLCGKLIHVRPRPLDRQVVLVSESELLEIDDQWGELLGRSSREEHRNQADKAKWTQHRKDLRHHMKSGDWGLYRNTRLEMGKILEREGKHRSALTTYLDVAYLDLNGPRNLGGLGDPYLVRQFPPFSRDQARLASDPVEGAVRCSIKLNLDGPEMQEAFHEVAEPMHQKLRLPVSPEEAWESLRSEMGRANVRSHGPN